MVERSDEAPLLFWAEGPAVSAPPPAAEPGSSGSGGRRLGGGWSAAPWDGEGPAEAAGAAAGRGGGGPDRGRLRGHLRPPHGILLLPQYLPNRMLGHRYEVSTRLAPVNTGNMVEWCLPQDIDLEGVEFKSMASGSHKIQSDFIYFRKGLCFGLACFANMPVESELERGARMKSVGILSPSYTLLYRYMHFLENQVRHQLEMPGHYSHLEAFYDDKKGVLPDSKGTPSSQQPVHWLPSIHRYMYPEMKITHPAGCMSQFIKFFGEQILVLWKFALLRKRILIFSPPPVGVVCYRVYCCCCLANVSLPGLGGTVPESKPFFYVNVADIEMLETEVSYVACTTEKIFEQKRDLYDVYVDNQNVKTHHEHLQPLLKINNADKEKYRRLNDQRQMLMYSQEVGEDCSSCEEDLFILFFMEQNNRIFQTLMEVSASQDKTLTADHARGMGLDPQGDRSFLMDLLEVYGIDVMLVIDNPCCT
ncbi:hypothetical protein DUI87_20067 [Hirundo rustica rustica]|nr:hypothetical protein DUI87_20067 [Hirundo rustica rustica]